MSSTLYVSTPPKCTLTDLVLPDFIAASIQDLLEDVEYTDVLLKSGIQPRKRVFLSGPPGCGKTATAHALAAALDMKLFVVSTAQTIGSHLGESEKHIERMFDFAAQNRVLLLIDEFDSIASARDTLGDSASRTETRMVNTILTKMESAYPLGLIVACSNFRESIDAAVLRRFDLSLEFPGPTREVLLEIANKTLRGRFGISAEEVLRYASTPSAVVKYCHDLIRRKVIDQAKFDRAQTLPLFDPANPAKSILASLDQPKKKKEPATHDHRSTDSVRPRHHATDRRPDGPAAMEPGVSAP